MATRVGEIIIAEVDPIIDRNDLRRGYVLKKELLQYFGPNSGKKHFVKEEDIVEGCGLIQYSWSSLDPSRIDELTVEHQLPVKDGDNEEDDTNETNLER